MPKTAAEKAIDDAIKARDVVGRAYEKHEAAKIKADAALTELKRTERELKWRLAHPDLPEEFDLDAHLAAQDSDDGFFDDQAQAELDEVPTLEVTDVGPAADVPSAESDGEITAEYDAADGIVAEQEFQASDGAVAAEPKPAPKSRAKAAKAKEPEPEPDVSGDAPDDDPFGDE